MGIVSLSTHEEMVKLSIYSVLKCSFVMVFVVTGNGIYFPLYF